MGCQFSHKCLVCLFKSGSMCGCRQPILSKYAFYPPDFPTYQLKKYELSDAYYY